MKKIFNQIVLSATFLLLLNISLLSQSIKSPRVMAEWEEVQGILLNWDEETCIYTLEIVKDRGWNEILRAHYNAITGTQMGIIKAAIEEGVKVFLLDNINNNYNVKDTLAAHNIVSPLIKFIEYNAENCISPWSRDNGPFSIYENITGELKLIGWLNDEAADIIAEYLNYPFIKMETDGGLFTDGGNFLTDGHNSLFYEKNNSKEINPPGYDFNQKFESVFGLKQFIELSPYRDHIDYYLKLVNEETIFVSSIPKSNYRYSDHIPISQDDSLKIEQAIDHIKTNFKSCYGRPYNVVRLKNAPTIHDISMNLTVLTGDLSYTNSLILNKTVIVPTYDNPETDNAALEAYREYMPGYKVVAVPAVYFAMGGGAIHCLTKEIGANNPIFISHAWLPDTVLVTTDYKIEAEISSQTGIASANLFWSLNPEADYQKITMSNLEGDKYSADIPAQEDNAHVYYYIEATSAKGKTIRKPMVAPEWAYNFVVDNDAVTDVADKNENLLKTYSLSDNYPNPFNPSTNISFTLPKSSNVKLAVYNIIGEQVATLVNQNNMAAGEYNYKFNAHNLPSGIYIYQLITEEFIKSKKMMLIK
ncbi:MAG: agmatine deiminase family protein [Ignavibacteria bacterium]|jgi:agmatine/peptidylarginine deiminase